MEDRFGRADEAELGSALPLQDEAFDAGSQIGLDPLGDGSAGDGCMEPSQNRALASQPGPGLSQLEVHRFGVYNWCTGVQNDMPINVSAA